MLRSLEVLDVSRNFLGGPIPTSLGNCTNMSVLVLSSSDFSARARGGRGSRIECNAFVGSTPNEVARLPNLAILWAPGARLGGNIPMNWGTCKSLLMVNLARNAFKGAISSILTNCPNLHYLNLSSNMLSGAFDRNVHVPSKAVHDLSSNLGHVAAPFNPTVAYIAYFKRAVLSQDPLPLSQNGTEIIHNQMSSTSPQAPSKQHHNHSGGALSPTAITCILVGSGVVVIILAAFVACWLVRRGKKNAEGIELIVSTNSNKVTLFEEVGVALNFDIIVHATENFSSRHCIGRGGFGCTYQAEIAPGNIVAVKRMSDQSEGCEQHFKAEISALSRIHHPHLITLIGYYYSRTEMLLIYNYLSSGNLDRFIRDRDNRFFEWSIFYKMATQIASVLVFLHDRCTPPILHSDIKPSNILLDSEYNAFLSDFGLSTTIARADIIETTGVAGTYGYVAPEYAMSGQLSTKADVYSFGVMLLELMSDKRVLDPSFHGQRDGYDIVSWAMAMLKRRRVSDVFTAKLLEMGAHDKLMKMLHLATLCTVESVVAPPAGGGEGMRIEKE